MSTQDDDLKSITRRVDKNKRRKVRDNLAEGGDTNCPKIVRQLAFLLYSQEKSVVSIFKKAGVAPCMLSQWVSGIRNPQLSKLVAVLDVLGYELHIVRKKESTMVRAAYPTHPDKKIP